MFACVKNPVLSLLTSFNISETRNRRLTNQRQYLKPYGRITASLGAKTLAAEVEAGVRIEVKAVVHREISLAVWLRRNAALLLTAAAAGTEEAEIGRTGSPGAAPRADQRAAPRADPGVAPGATAGATGKAERGAKKEASRRGVNQAKSATTVTAEGGRRALHHGEAES